MHDAQQWGPCHVPTLRALSSSMTDSSCHPTPLTLPHLWLDASPLVLLPWLACDLPRGPVQLARGGPWGHGDRAGAADRGADA